MAPTSSAPAAPGQPKPDAVSPNSFRSFATFLRGYMGVMPLITAAFAPVLTVSHAIPIYSQQATSLGTMSDYSASLSSLGCFTHYTRSPLVSFTEL